MKGSFTLLGAALAVGSALSAGAMACSAGTGGSAAANASASAKPLSTCAKDLAEEKAPDKPVFPKATHEISRLLPKTKATAPASTSTTRLGNVETTPDYSQVLQAMPAQFVDVGWRKVPAAVPTSPASAMPDWQSLHATMDRLSDLRKQTMRAKNARAECETERCRTCFDDLVDDDAVGITAARDEVLATTKRLRAELRKAPASDADALLMWAEVLSIEADFLDPNDHEVTTLEKESLALFFKAGALPKARADVSAWARYGAMREATELGGEASVPGVSARGRGLQLEIGKAFLASATAPLLKAEVAFRTASLAASAGERLGASVLRDAITARVDVKDDSAAMVGLVARTYWARAAIDEGEPLEAVRALAPVYTSREILDIVAESNGLLAEALRDVGRYDGPSLGVMDVDTYADVAMTVASYAAQYHDLDLVQHSLVTVWKDAPNTLKLPQALRSLTYGVVPGTDTAKATKELDALMKLDPSGRLTSPWAESMRSHDPPYTDDIIRTNMLATGVYPPAPDPNRDADARWRATDVAQKCHAGNYDGPDLEVDVDAAGRVSIKATGTDPNADWVNIGNPSGVGGTTESLRQCLVRVGPIVFRTFGSPVTFKLVPYQRSQQYGGYRY